MRTESLGRRPRVAREASRWRRWMAVMQPHTRNSKSCSSRRRESSRQGSSSPLPEKINALTLVLDFWPPGLLKNKFLLSSAAPFMELFTAVLGNSDRPSRRQASSLVLQQLRLSQHPSGQSLGFASPSRFFSASLCSAKPHKAGISVCFL